jgi:hypothetical protein
MEKLSEFAVMVQMKINTQQSEFAILVAEVM